MSGSPNMTDQTAPTNADTTDAQPFDAANADLSWTSNVLANLQTRVVREARRDTWFVVNETTENLATVPLAASQHRSIRRVQVNGEVAEFSAHDDLVMVRPRHALRPGAGTIIVVHYR